METQQELHLEPEKRQRHDWWLIILILGLFLFGLTIRGYSYLTSAPTTSKAFIENPAAKHTPTGLRGPTQSADSRRLQPVETQIEQTSPAVISGDWLTACAPYLTEGGLSFFLGFCIGYFLRVVAKTVVFVVGALYLALILLSHYGMIVVDWGTFQHLLQQLLLNTRAHLEGLQGLLTVGIPSVTMGGLGIWRGMKKA